MSSNVLKKTLKLPTATKIIFIFLFSDIFVKSVYSADSNGQKAHFQVEDKSGDLKVIATKDLAKVTSQADSVQVVVKPGMADYPVVKSDDKPIVHVVDGWNSISMKKSSILTTKKKTGDPSLNGKRLGSGKLKTLHKHDKRKYTFFTKHLREKNPNSNTNKKILPLHSNFKVMSSVQKPEISERSNGFERKSPVEAVKPNKKSTLLKADEVGFQVTGSAGKLNMDVTKAQTKLSSESGTVDVFLKRKAGGNSDSPKQKDVVAASGMVHLAPELVGGDFDDVGLRKSSVPTGKRPTTRS